MIGFFKKLIQVATKCFILFSRITRPNGVYIAHKKIISILCTRKMFGVGIETTSARILAEGEGAVETKSARILAEGEGAIEQFTF